MPPESPLPPSIDAVDTQRPPDASQQLSLDDLHADACKKEASIRAAAADLGLPIDTPTRPQLALTPANLREEVHDILPPDVAQECVDAVHPDPEGGFAAILDLPPEAQAALRAALDTPAPAPHPADVAATADLLRRMGTGDYRVADLVSPEALNNATNA